MSENDITQIKVGGSTVGIIGLKGAMDETAGECAEKSDNEVADILFTRLSKRNYIPDNDRVQDEYKKAFFREFKRSLGEPYEEEPSGFLEIKVLGRGCSQCDKLEQELIGVMSETGITADLEHIRDIKEIGKYGVMGMPALIINGIVKSVGRVPSRNQLISWIREANSRMTRKE